MKNNKWNVYLQRAIIKLPTIIFWILIILLVVIGIWYYKGNDGTKLTALAGGLITSLIAIIIQFVIEWRERNRLEQLESMEIFRVLPNRDDKREYYYQLLKNANDQIDFMGVTSHSFLHDFADSLDSGGRSSVLRKALNDEVKVRILVTRREALESNKQSKFDEAEKTLKQLKEIYKDKIDIFYLDKVPSYSLVRVDNECIVGTIIPNVNSSETSAIHASVNSPFLKCYLKDFDSNCEPIS